MLDAVTTRARLHNTLRLSSGGLDDIMRPHIAAAERAADLLWRRNPAAWSSDPTVQKSIANRLGWLDSPGAMRASLDRVREFAGRVRTDGFSDVVLLGMGGSSLAPEVMRAILGVAPGWPRFHMLDSTDPAAVRAASTVPDQTLYLLASKSGTTIEPNSLAAHFRQTLETAGIREWSQHFVAITDDGTALSSRARSERFRDLFINPPDIGGRYSALSFFGLVPAALMGQDIGALLGWGEAMLEAARENGPTARNPAVGLGLAMGAAALSGRDKLTLVADRRLEPLGLWIEQLVAESTGKQGVGIVPIAGEPTAPISMYRDDRFFVQIDDGSGVDFAADAPKATVELAEPSALGAEFIRWEIATAVAGALLRVNPFDEPNVQQAKDATRVLLDRYKGTRELPVSTPDGTLAQGVTITLTSAARAALGTRPPAACLRVLGPRDYIALLAYTGPDLDLARAFQTLRTRLRDLTGAATMFGYGPRYLHSTGQLHKGGPNSGVFLLVTATPAADVPIPGEAFSFGTLEQAQALGDFASLEATGRRALNIHLPSPDAGLIDHVADALLRDALER